MYKYKSKLQATFGATVETTRTETETKNRFLHNKVAL